MDPRPASPGAMALVATGDHAPVSASPTPTEALGGTHLGYLPALDGLRALAVLGVLAYHGGNGWLPGGYLGVDFFFTLSGFLITSLLVIEWRAEGRIALRRFYARRARRLLPALFLCLGLIALYVLVYAAPVQVSRFRGDTWSALLYVSNWRMIFSGQSYFEQFLAPSPFAHLWSLAIEEQWYFGWPLVMIALLRVTSGRLARLGAIIGVLAVASAAWMAWLAHSGAALSRIYLGTDTRAQALLVGAGCAVLVQAVGLPTRTWLRFATQVFALGALVGLIIAWWQLEGSVSGQYRFGYLAHALGAAIIIVGACIPGVVRAMFSPAPLRYIGKISYGLYLYHWPLYLTLTPERTALTGGALFWVRVLASVAVAAASYHFVEMPIRHGVLHSWRRVGIAIGGGVMIVGVLVTVSYARVPKHIQDARDVPAASGAGRLPVPIISPLPPLRVMIKGDSLAHSLAQGYPQLAREALLDGVDGGRYGCGFAEIGDLRSLDGLTQDPATCGDMVGEARRTLSDVRPTYVVFFGGVWEMADRRIDGDWYRYPDPRLDAAITEGWSDVIAAARASGVQPVIATTPYFQRITLDGVQPRATNPKRVDHLNALLRGVGQRTNTPVIDTNAFLSPKGAFARTIDGVQIRNLDGTHFTRAGAYFTDLYIRNALLSLIRSGELAPPTPSPPAR